MQPVSIIDRGRGPELAGTRITIFDLIPYFEDDWTDASIALWFGLSSAQVQAMRKYLAENKESVMADNARILARIARGNPPEVEAKRAGSRAKLRALKEKLSQKRVEEQNGEGNSRRCKS
jgi:uncharacterized protein (DUF433 family)